MKPVNYGPTKTTKIQTNLQTPDKEVRPEYTEEAQPLNKEQVQKHLLAFGEDDLSDSAYDPEQDPVPAVIFDSELQFIKQLKAVDIIFLLDSTYSMSPYMKGIKRLCRKILWDAQRCLTQYLVDEVDVLMAGIVAYKDHDQEDKINESDQENEAYVSAVICDLTADFTEFTTKLMLVQASGGRDDAEAVMDGLNEVVHSVNWRENSFKFVYHILDMPGHGAKFGKVKDSHEGGCPCGLDYEELLNEMRSKSIEYTVVKLSNAVDMMLEEFGKIMKVEVLDVELPFDKAKDGNQEEEPVPMTISI